MLNNSLSTLISAVTALRLMTFFADCMHVDCIDETDRFCFLCDINGMCSMLCVCMVYTVTEEHKVRESYYMHVYSMCFSSGLNSN